MDSLQLQDSFQPYYADRTVDEVKVKTRRAPESSLRAQVLQAPDFHVQLKAVRDRLALKLAAHK